MPAPIQRIVTRNALISVLSFTLWTVGSAELFAQSTSPRTDATVANVPSQFEARLPTSRPFSDEPVGNGLASSRFAMLPVQDEQPVQPEIEANDDSDDLEKRLKEVEKQLEKRVEDEKTKKEEDAKKPSVKPRGRIHTDANWFYQSASNRNSVGDIQDGTYFRRARLGFDAKAFEVTEYRLDFEMASGGGRPSIFDAYGKITQLPVVGNLMIGHFREPFSLEAQTSSNWLTFMERGLNTTFDPSRNWGLMIFNHNEAEDFFWSAGVFREGSDNFGDDIGDAGERAFTSRASWLPYYDEASEGRHFFEVGTSYSYRNPDNRFLAGPGGPEESIVRYQARPEDNLNEDGVGSVPAFISVSIPDAAHVQLVGLESTWNLGSLNLQSEFVSSYVDRFGQAPVYFNGTYVQASYFLTGECRQWDRKLGTFGRAQVLNPFRYTKEDVCCWTKRGAWEVAMRWNYLDLSDGNINGGYLESTTFGLNWYLNPYMRMMFNYSLNDLHDFADGRSDAQTFAYRLDVHF